MTKKNIIAFGCLMLLGTNILIARTREQDHNQVCNLILDRWSSRAFSGASISQKELETLTKAASWAPSCYNHQPWRFIYAHRDTPTWKKLFDLLVPFNQEWAQNAAVLVVVVSKKLFDHVDAPSPSYSFDTGAACQNLALQAWDMDLVVHAMGGFDREHARTELNISNDYNVEAMLAIGHPGRKENLNKILQEREIPAERKPLAEIMFEGSM